MTRKQPWPGPDVDCPVCGMYKIRPGVRLCDVCETCERYELRLEKEVQAAEARGHAKGRSEALAAVEAEVRKAAEAYPEGLHLELADTVAEAIVIAAGVAVDAVRASQPSPAETRGLAYEGLVWRVVANAGRLAEAQKPRWSHVMEATGHGSTQAQAMCRDAGFDPDELVPSTPPGTAGEGEAP